MQPWAGRPRRARSSACRSRSAPSGTPSRPNRMTDRSVGDGNGVDRARVAPAGVGEAMIGRIFREESGRSVATLIRVFGQIEIAEDSVQDAFALALRVWPRDGLPPNPGGWITTTARRCAIDRLRRDVRGRELLRDLAVLEHPNRPGAQEVGPVPDDRLLRAVLAVIYLIYDAGADPAAAPAGDGLRAEAIRLARILTSLMSGEPEATGLLALLLLTESRFRSRVTADGALVLLRDQDRSRWDRALIDEGHALVRACLRRDRPGPYQLQAAINAVHTDADSMQSTDWPQILTLYDQLLALAPTPVVALNRAIAVGEVHGPQAALDLVDRLNLPGHPRRPAAPPRPHRARSRRLWRRVRSRAESGGTGLPRRAGNHASAASVNPSVLLVIDMDTRTTPNWMI